MPRKCLMSWEGKPNFRWVKMYGTIRYRVSCDKLGLPPSAWTEEESYQLANAWWTAKRLAVDVASANAHHHADTINDLTAKQEYLKRHGLADEELPARIEAAKSLAPLDNLPHETETARRIEAARLFGIEIPVDLDPLALEAIFGQGRIWAERRKAEKSQPVATTLGVLAERYGKDKMHKAVSGVETGTGARFQIGCLKHFIAFAGASTPAANINYDLWEKWYVSCKGKYAQRKKDEAAGWSADYAAKVFSVAKAFVRWLYESDVLPALPKNINAIKRHTFHRAGHDIITYTLPEIQAVLAEASHRAGGQHKLHILLMLNCGATQKDISDLRKDQCDTEAGTIYRRRSKTEDKANTPKVRYTLWPITNELLRLHMSSHPTLALTNASGQQWLRQTMHGDSIKAVDGIANHFDALKLKLGISKTLKSLKKTSATVLKSSSEFRDLRHYFLGHSDKDLADKSYSAESNTLLAAAIRWLGAQYGLA